MSYIQIEPYIVCKYLVVRQVNFIIYLSKSPKFTERLDVLLRCIDPTYILRDLTVLRQSTDSILERMKMVEASGIESPRPWMVKCLRSQLDM